MRPHEKLDVYVMAHALAVRIHRLSISACDVREEVVSLVAANDELCRRLYNYVCAVERQHDPKRPDPKSS